MKTPRKIASLLLAGVLACGIALPGQAAQAANVQPLPFDINVNNTPVTLSQALLIDGYTYVQLRELAKATNMEVSYIKPGSGPSWLMHNGPVADGVHISQPSFIYTKDNVPDYKHVLDGQPFKGVDITEVVSRYNSAEGDFDYAFCDEGLRVRENGEEKIVPFIKVHASDHVYVTVDTYKEKIQPYMLDICMQ